MSFVGKALGFAKPEAFAQTPPPPPLAPPNPPILGSGTVQNAAAATRAAAAAAAGGGMGDTVKSGSQGDKKIKTAGKALFGD